jgi:hypothetical protein
MTIRWPATALGVLVLTLAGVGQEPTPEPPVGPPVYAADGLLPTDKPHACGNWHTDIVFGLPIALRAQRRVGDRDLWVEGGLALYTIVPSVFVGARLDGSLYQGKRNTFYVRPGLDFYYSPIHSSGGFLFGRINGIYAVTADADLTWRRKWTDGLHGHFGLKAGLGVGTAGYGAFPLPVLGLTCGFQY